MGDGITLTTLLGVVAYSAAVAWVAKAFSTPPSDERTDDG